MKAKDEAPVAESTAPIEEGAEIAEDTDGRVSVGEPLSIPSVAIGFVKPAVRLRYSFDAEDPTTWDATFGLVDSGQMCHSIFLILKMFTSKIC